MGRHHRREERRARREARRLCKEAERLAILQELQRAEAIRREQCEAARMAKLRAERMARLLYRPPGLANVLGVVYDHNFMANTCNAGGWHFQ